MKLTNPVFSKKRMCGVYNVSNAMSVQGAVNKTGILTAVLFLAAGWMWYNQPVGTISGYVIGAAIAGFVIALVTVFNPRISPFTSIIYAALEGITLGGISAFSELTHPGIVTKAVTITFCILFSMLLIYKFQIIRVTSQFYSGVVAATGGICLMYLFNLVIGFWGVQIPYLHEGGGWFGILISLAIIVIASLNLILDFHNIEEMAEHRAPKYMEWYGAFGIMITMVWLYLEVLKLLKRK